MTDVWIDPVELDAMAGVISQQSQRAQDAFAGDLGLRDVALPAHLEWVREEGAALAQEAAVVTLGYLLNALDLGVRAEAVRVEQGTSTAVTAPTEVQQEGFLLSGSPMVTGSPAQSEGYLASGSPTVMSGNFTGGPQAGGFMLDQVIGPDGQVRAGSGGIDTMALTRLLSGSGTGLGAPGGFDSDDAIRQTLTGVPWRNGRPVDDWGSNDHTSSSIETDPITGRPRVRP